MAPNTPAQIRGLYKVLLREAARFPSKKRTSIIRDIKLEFRENAELTDKKEVDHAIEVAMRGLSTLQKYTGLNKKSQEWSITLEQDPLGRAQAVAEKPELQKEPQPMAVDGIPTAMPTKLQ
jgi:hypothetical protein